MTLKFKTFGILRSILTNPPPLCQITPDRIAAESRVNFGLNYELSKQDAPRFPEHISTESHFSSPAGMFFNKNVLSNSISINLISKLIFEAHLIFISLKPTSLSQV
jgi:hypothetical protein